MAQATKVVSFVALVCIVYTSILSPTGARTMPSGVHSQEPLDDGATSRSHFEDFVRALTAARTNAGLIVLPANEDMPNDVFPLDTEHRHRAASEELERAKESQQRAFKSNPTPANGALQKRSGGRYCGSVLADVLELVCGKSFLSLFGNNKRSAPPEKAAYKDNGPAAEQPESWPFVSGNKALQVLSNQHSFHRYTRGVHDECCLKACSFSELTLYCSEPVIKPPSSNHFF